MPRLGVLGWPVAHSRSPVMQQAAFDAAGLSGWSYQLLPVPPDLLGETIRALPASGFVGANVTIPHKEAALAIADQASPAARAIGAANTLSFSPRGGVHAENTDAPGLLGALPFPPAGRSALVLGAGGMARAAVWALLGAGASDVRVWNRTPARARALALDLGAVATEHAGPADLLINCTAIGGPDPATFKNLPVSADGLSRYACVVDLVYGNGPTALLSAAAERGALVVDGLEILVRQGALSFERWTGRPAPVEAMRTAARQTRDNDLPREP
jgi:shikimate dehydrogenase